jgi:hypothetical protein
MPDEELIAHGWDEDVWFHVDNLSSAHIYVRLPEGEDWEAMTKELMTDCAQLTKANSIEGMQTFFFHLYGVESDRALNKYRQQEGQCHDCVHALEQLEERWQHGGGTSGIQGSAQGTLNMRIASCLAKCSLGQARSC